MNGLTKADFAAGQEVLQPRVVKGVARYFGRDWPTFWRRLNTRRMLLKLNDQQLRDIGLTRGQAEREASLPFWKL